KARLPWNILADVDNVFREMVIAEDIQPIPQQVLARQEALFNGDPVIARNSGTTLSQAIQSWNATKSETERTRVRGLISYWLKEEVFKPLGGLPFIYREPLIDRIQSYAANHTIVAADGVERRVIAWFKLMVNDHLTQLMEKRDAG